MANSDTLQKQDGFKSQFGFIMAAVGSCVGMANVWRFPMLVSRYGGLTFLIPYAIFAFIICPVRHDGGVLSGPLGPQRPLWRLW